MRIWAMSGALAKISAKPTEPDSIHTAKMPSAKPKSPTRFTMKAFMAASLADFLSNQKPISRYDARPTPSQPKNSWTRLSEVTSISMKKVNRLR